MDCCHKNEEQREKGGFWVGLVYGLVPHTACIAFIVFSVLGVTVATTFFKPLLLNPYFFHILVALSIGFATISALFYFKKQGFVSFSRGEEVFEINFLPRAIRRKWRYLLTLYGTTICINLLLFMVVFPVTANLQSESSLGAAVRGTFMGGGEPVPSDSNSWASLQVAIPCPGHASLIIGELKGITGVENVKFRFPNLFDVGYDSEKTSKEQMLSLDVFQTYKATVIEERTGADDLQSADDVEYSQPLSNVGSCCGGGNGGLGCGGGNGGGGCSCGR